MATPSASVAPSAPLATDPTDAESLAPVVRRLLGTSSARIVEWRAEPIGFAHVVSITGGLTRFSGTAARPDGEVVPWSVVQKVVKPPAALAPIPALEAAGLGREEDRWSAWARYLLDMVPELEMRP